jgi:ElaB/YqjD/DUF883 family membrane-anchored ribosome-binding protein
MSVSLATAIPYPGAGGADRANFDELLDGVDDLIKRVADVESPEILRVRAKVYAALVVARSSLSDCANHVRERSLPMVDDVQSDDGRLPAEELGAALLLGVGLALVASLQQY